MTDLAAAGEQHNLPERATPLIGREQELRTTRGLLLSDDVRVLTLAGPAGVGKTRLALALAAVVASAFPDGAWFVDLAPLRDPAAVPIAIGHVLGVGEDISVAADSQRPGHGVMPLLRHLRARRMLLVLDNFEQLLPAAAVIAELAAASPDTKILVTSRERLQLRSEHLFSVPPLTLPDLGSLPPLAMLAGVPAVALFLRRARAANPEFELTSDNAASIAELCSRLDGLPLAIELAAAHARVLTPQALLAHLEPRLTSLHWSARDMPARHQTLWAAISWSDELLTDEERTLFRRIGVFTGGFTLDAAERVGGRRSEIGSERRQDGEPANRQVDPTSDLRPPTSVLDLVGSLVDKSLVLVAQPVNREPRFAILETIREFALEQLDASGEVAATRRAHAAYFLTLAERAAPELAAPDQAAWMTRLELEHANLRSALDWLAAYGEGDAELRLAVALMRFWRSRGYPREGQRRLEGALMRTPETSPALRMLALDGAGFFAQQVGADAHSVTRHEEALLLARSLGDEHQIALILNNLGALATRQHDDSRATALLEESLEVSRRLGDHWATALTLYKLGVLVEMQGDRERAAVLLRESLATFRELGDRRSVAVVLTTLAQAPPADAPVSDSSRSFLEEGLALCRELGDRGATSIAVEMTVGVVARRVTPERLARLLGAADALHEAMGITLSRNSAAHHARAEETARAELNAPTYAAAWEAGRALPLDAIIDEALAAVRETAPPHERVHAPLATNHSTQRLTRREREVLRLLAHGLSNREVAQTLSIGERTARFHVTAILGKLGVRTRGQAVAVAMRHRLL